ncbi:MAG: hypothetical protein LQ352_003690 [Teloschistes flavicans]|nr:MAG: hypothetical protein LQ352_003690 [Teloschistes flavicans]
MSSVPTSYPSPGHQIATILGLVSMSTFFVFLKICVRFKTKLSFGADDYLIYVSAILNWAYLGVKIWGYYEGNHGTFNLASLPLPNVSVFLKYIYIESVLYAIIITLAKFSVLCLYRRIFIFEKRVSQGTRIIFLCQSTWAVVHLGLTIFRCNPIAASWNIALQSKCISSEKIVIGTEAFNSALDFAMLALPVSVVRKLQLPRKQKVSVSAIFLLGGFVGIMAIVRIIFTAQSGADASGQWVYAQINVGIVCACLPTLKPLVPKDRTVMITFRNAVSSILLSLKSAGPNFSTKVQATDGRKNSTSTGHRHDRYRNMSSVAFLTEAVGGIEPFDPNRDFPMDKIRVRHDVDVV